MIDLNNSIPVNPLFVWTVPEEYYTIAQTCQMLHITTRRINAYMDREDDPMPFRLFPDSKRGAFIHKDDLRDWIMRNTVLARDGRSRDGQTSSHRE